MRYRTEINAGMRVKLVRALILVHNELHLQPETLYLAVSIMDRFLSLHHVPRTQLHIVGISSLLIATKYEEDWVPKVYIPCQDVFFFYFFESGILHLSH